MKQLARMSLQTWLVHPVPKTQSACCWETLPPLSVLEKYTFNGELLLDDRFGNLHKDQRDADSCTCPDMALRAFRSIFASPGYGT